MDNAQRDTDRDLGAPPKSPEVFAKVVVPPVPTEFSYRVPPDIDAQRLLGSRVSVPFGKRIAFGYVVAVDNTPPSFLESANKDDAAKIKSLQPDARIVPCFSADLLALFRWMSTYYAEPLSSIIDLAVPNVLTPLRDEIVDLQTDNTSSVKGKMQTEIIAFLRSQNGRSQASKILKALNTTRAPIKALADKGIVKLQKIEVSSFEHVEQSPSVAGPCLFTLNSEQACAYHRISESLDSNTFSTYLIHGVTGSGKTEVYINLAARAIEQGKGVLIIVPEIALTPQVIERFEGRLNTRVAVLHSGVGQRPRWDGWNALLDGSCQIAIGARSAVFAPIRNLGLIVVDEEHDHSFKQSEGVRYHARDVAIMRAKHAGCPVILGSATPSLDTYHLAQSGRYVLLPLEHRHNNVKHPRLEIVDMTGLKPWNMPSKSLSPVLHKALGEVLAQKQQAFILYNRRGFASYFQCDRCSLVLECPHCSVTLTYYQKRGSLLCHYCGFSTPPVENCPVCATAPPDDGTKTDEALPVFSPRGGGTERVFDEIVELFPDAKVARLDRDVASSVDDYKKILNGVRCGAIDILVGTQLLAKGHDLPNVTLVGIVDCDVGLHMPDFRAGERVFQLITQASGRAGRAALPGRAILQTRVPKHPSVRYAALNAFSGFATEELAIRRTFTYPPFSRLLRILCTSQSQELAKEKIVIIAKAAREFSKKLRPTVHVMGPVPAPLERLRAHWRWHLVLKCESVATLHRALTALRKEFRSNKNVRIAFDIDPQDMM